MQFRKSVAVIQNLAFDLNHHNTVTRKTDVFPQRTLKSNMAGSTIPKVVLAELLNVLFNNEFSYTCGFIILLMLSIGNSIIGPIKNQYEQPKQEIVHYHTQVKFCF